MMNEHHFSRTARLFAITLLVLAGSYGVTGGFALPIAEAASDPGTQIIETMSQQDVRDLLAREGYGGVDPISENVLVFKIEGVSVAFITVESEENLRLRAFWSDTDADVHKVNTWNRSKRYTKSYIDDDGDVNLEADLDLAGGVTEARVIDFLNTYKVSLPIFSDDVL